MFLSILLFAFWSLVFIIGKFAANQFPPLLLTAGRTIIAGSTMLLYVLIKDKSQFKLLKKTILPLGYLGISTFYLATNLEYFGLKTVSSGKTSLIFSLAPFFAAIFSYFHFNEKITKRKTLGILIGFGGTLPLIFLDKNSGSFSKSLFHVSLGDLSILSAVILFGYGYIVIKILLNNFSISPIFINGVSMLIGGIASTVHFLLKGKSVSFFHHENIYNFLFFIIVTTIISNFISANVYIHLLKKYSNTFLSFISLLSPFFVIAYEWILFQKLPSIIYLISATIFIFGLWVINEKELKYSFLNNKN